MSFYASFPIQGGSGGVPIYATFGAFPAGTNAGDLAVAADTGNLYEWNGSMWQLIASPGGALSIGTIDSTAASANGADISGGALIMQSASVTVPGLVNNTTQSLSGNKTFTGSISASNLSGTNTGNVSLGTANGLSIVGQVLSLALSSTSTTGALSSTDWNTFNNKQSTLTLGNLTDVGTDGIVVTGGTGAVVGSGTSIAQHVSDSTHNGYLSSVDWSTFNSKFNLPSLTSGSVLFSNGTTIAQDNANFFWDNTAKNLILSTGIVTPSILDPTSVEAVSPLNRQLLDAGGTASVSVDWLNRFLVAADQSPSIDWTGRFLFDSTAVPQLSWSTAGVAFNQLTPNTVPYLDGSVILTSSAITPTELGYISGVTSSIQTQLDSKFVLPALTAGSVVFSNGTTLVQDNANLFWDDTANSLGIGTNTPSSTLQVVGTIANSVSVIDAGVAALTSSATSTTTVDGSNTTIGVQGVATGIVDVGFTNDKSIASFIGTAMRGNGSDEGSLDLLSGMQSLMFHNSGAAGVTTEVDGITSLLFLQQGTITRSYDFRAITIPAGTGVVTSPHGIYIEPYPGGDKQNWISGKMQLGGSSFTAAVDQVEIPGTLGLRGSTSGKFSQAAADTTTDYNVKWPAAQGAASSVPTNDGSGNLSWSVPPTSAARAINAQTGTTYTFILDDGSGFGNDPLVTADNAASQTYTVPDFGSVAFPVGTQIDVMQLGAGQVTFAPAGGVTINSLGGNMSIAGQYVAVSLINVATDSWVLIGNLTT